MVLYLYHPYLYLHHMQCCPFISFVHSSIFVVGGGSLLNNFTTGKFIFLANLAALCSLQLCTNWHSPSSHRLAAQQSKCRLLCSRYWAQATDRIPVYRQDFWDYACTLFFICLCRVILNHWCYSSRTSGINLEIHRIHIHLKNQFKAVLFSNSWYFTSKYFLRISKKASCTFFLKTYV